MKNIKVLRKKISNRGGGIEVELLNLKIHGKSYHNVKMTAYCNYLGGGILGSIQGDCNIHNWKLHPELVKRNEELKKYFHSLLYTDDFNEFEDLQKRPTSAY